MRRLYLCLPFFLAACGPITPERDPVAIKAAQDLAQACYDRGDLALAECQAFCDMKYSKSRLDNYYPHLACHEALVDAYLPQPTREDFFADEIG